MKKLPEGWTTISSSIHYRDTRGMMDWLMNAFGFEERIAVPGENGEIVHGELELPGGILMISSADTGDPERFGLRRASPADVGGANTQTLQLYVDDADAHFERAKAAGATIVQEPFISDHGEDYWADKSYGCLDPEGHLWWIVERIRG